LGLDPTNNCIADQFHIHLTVGRNYNDCAPVKGVFKGNETHQSSTQNSYRRNLEMIQQQQQQQ
jgi:hypothetical protein